MSIGGATLGLAGLLASEWAIRFINNDTGAVEEYTPIILSFGILIIAPVVAASIALVTSRRSSGHIVTVEAAVGALTGSVLYALIALSLLNQYSGFVEAAPTTTDLATIAGLVALTSVVAAVVVSLVTPTATDDVVEESAVPVPNEPGPEYTT